MRHEELPIENLLLYYNRDPENWMVIDEGNEYVIIKHRRRSRTYKLWKRRKINMSKVKSNVYYEIKGYSNYFIIFDIEGHGSIISFKNFIKNPQGSFLKQYNDRYKNIYFIMTDDVKNRRRVFLYDIVKNLGNYYSVLPLVLERNKICSSPDAITFGTILSKPRSKNNTVLVQNKEKIVSFENESNYKGRSLCTYKGPLP